MASKVWLLTILICTIQGAASWTTWVPDDSSTIPETTMDQTVTTPSDSTDAHTSRDTPSQPPWPPWTTEQTRNDENVILIIGEIQAISSPNYPSNYDNNAHYNWYITGVLLYDVLIHFLDFNLQSNDNLTIGTGDSPTSPGSVEVVSLSGSSLPSNIRLNSPTCWMKFSSDYTGTSTGFELEMSIVNSTTSEDVKLIVGETHNISSPNYPSNYPDNLVYTWVIYAPRDYDIFFHFLDFYLQLPSDTLYIGSGDWPTSAGSVYLYALTGPLLPPDIRLNTNTSWIKFASDESTNERGFKVQLSLLNSSSVGYCKECCDCGQMEGCSCDSACQYRGDCCYDYTPYCSQVRIVNGFLRYAGRVEVFTDGVWGTVCDHDFDFKDALVLCKSMGYGSVAEIYSGGSYGQGVGAIHLANINCTGRETSIWDCPHNGVGYHDCTHADDAGINCHTSSSGYCEGRCEYGFIEGGSCFCDLFCKEYDDCCRDYDSYCSKVNLRNGSNYLEGRVEVFAYGVWGTVCDDSWDIDDAKVVCRSMGFPGAEAAFFGAAFGEGTGNILLDNVNCTGQESSIFDCPHNGIGVHDCTHADDAGVRCSLKNDENVTLLLGEAQTIASPNFPDTFYNNVVCTWFIKVPSGYHVLVHFTYLYLQLCDDRVIIGTGDSPTSSDSVQLASLSGRPDISFMSDIRLYTPTNWIQFISDESGSYYGFQLQLNITDLGPVPARLVNGSYPNEGRVEVYSNDNDTWGTVCGYGWDIVDATVVCRSMGYPDAVSSYGGALYGMGSGPILLNNVDCDGDEDSVFYCPSESKNINCTHSEDAGVVCYPNVRLIDGSSPSEGRVEIFYNGVWGSVCDYYWGNDESRVICRSLGFPDILTPQADFGAGTLNVLLKVLRCDGDERSIYDCCHYGIGNDDCDTDKRARVRCAPNVRLINGGSSNEGRVEVYHGETWGTVCDEGWSTEEARVICKSLGYVDALQAFGNAYFGQGTGDILLDEVACTGNESSIFHCYHSGVGNTLCAHTEDAGVRCETPEDQNVILMVGEIQNITSPNYPSNYDNNARHNWYIKGVSDYDVLIHFLDFSLQADSDFLRIGTGDSQTSPGSVLLVELSGSSLPADIRLETQIGWMQFTSDWTSTAKGFQLEISLRNSPSETTLASTTDVDTSPYTPAWSPWTTIPLPADENVTLTIGEMQSVRSPNYPSNYHNYAHYNWYITAVSGYDVLIHFVDFSTEYCCDYLKIGAGDSPTSPGSVEVVSLSGSSLPSDVRLLMLYEPKCWMQFTSNSYGTSRGFEVQLSITISTSDEMLKLNIGETMNISSPNYPLNYDDNTQYNWYIETPSGYDVLVHFFDFYVEPNYDYLLIGSGESSTSLGSIRLYSLSGYSIPSDRRIYGPRGWITFTSDSSVTYRGFELRLSLINASLGGHCDECCECGDLVGCQCDSACQTRGDCCYDYTPYCSQARLVNGNDHSSGRVELFASGVWGTVCSHDWDLKDAQVVCRSIGFHRALNAYVDNRFGQGTGDIHLDNVNCTGRESSIFYCPHNGIGVHDCTHGEDAGVRCTTGRGGYCQGRCDYGFIEEGTCFCDVFCAEYDDCCLDYDTFCSEVHLRDGSNYLEGRVEVFADDDWGTVCDDIWDINDAKVVCRSMGFPGVEAAFPNAAFGEGKGNITLDNVGCTGQESSIFDCPHNGIGVHDCTHADDAGVRCSLNNDENVTLILGEVQTLTSPNYPDMYYDNIIYNWLITTPPGYHVLISILYVNLETCGDRITIGTGDSPTSSDSVQLASVSGIGEPKDIRLFTPTGWIQFTSDESTISYNGFWLQITDTDSTAAPARLVNGSYPNEGRIEVYSNEYDTWGTVCDHEWDIMDATVVCRSMGFPDAVRSYEGALYGMSSGPILLNNVDCDGDEDNVFYCAYEIGNIDNCTQSEEAGAMCYPNFRLVNGSSPSEGRVEFYYDGNWGTVCDIYWSTTESRVLCRSLGFPDVISYFHNAYFGEGAVDSNLYLRDCSGDESSIFDCCLYGFFDYPYCGHSNDVGVRCEPNVRLVNGGSSNEGRVEVYYGDTWGTVCDEGWGVEEARVICKSLGYSDANEAFGNAYFGQGSGDILLDDVDCIGNESSIFYCYHQGVGVTSCSHQNDAGVRCATGETVTTPSTFTDIDTSPYATDLPGTTSHREYTTRRDWWPLTTLAPRIDENVTLVVGEPQTITSPNYPLNYYNGAQCYWYITAPLGYHVLIHFLDFNTEMCCDHLKIGEGDSPTSNNSVQLASLSGSSIPSDIRLMTPTGWMSFTSDVSVTAKGFQLEMSLNDSTTGTFDPETTRDFEGTLGPETTSDSEATLDPETTRDSEGNATEVATEWVTTFTTPEPSVPWLVIGVATVVSVLVIAILICTCIFVFKRKKRRHMEEGLLENEVFLPDHIELAPTPKKKKKNVIHKNRVSRPILLKDIETHYKWLKADSESTLIEEYEEIQAVGSVLKMNYSETAEMNKTKNRFNKILPYEHTRVKLVILKGKPETDYINANYIPGFNSPREYIACQGPLPETTNDMWRMIWEKKSTIIVMMTRLVEGGKDKCHQYWPQKKGHSVTYGSSLEVTLRSELSYEGWTTRTFTLQKNKMKREVIQLQFTSWPDHGVPEETKPMLDFVRNVRECIQNKCVTKPVIVHCSAGVGRTGVFIALDRLTQHMKENDFVDICGVVCEMRMHRNYLVQTEKQYIFLHDCLMDFFHSDIAP